MNCVPETSEADGLGKAEEHCRSWTEANGEYVYDWYLETQVESAKESEPAPPPPIQLSFAGDDTTAVL